MYFAPQRPPFQVWVQITSGIEDANELNPVLFMIGISGWAQSDQGWGGCFVELQIGVAPSQLHTWPVPAKSSHHHSEYYKLMHGMPASDQLWSADYKQAVQAASAILGA